MAKAEKAAKAATPETSGSKDLIGKDKRKQYQATGKTASGAKSVTCGDEVALAMTGMDEETVRTVAGQNGVLEKYDGWKGNFGLRRMILGGILRGKLNRGETVTIGKTKLQPDPEVVKAAKEKAEQKAAKNKERLAKLKSDKEKGGKPKGKKAA